MDIAFMERKKMNEMDDDCCYECAGYGDDYFINDEGELECCCPTCPMNPMWDEDDIYE